MQIPKLDKIVINIGVGEAKDNAKALEAAVAKLKENGIEQTWIIGVKNPVAETCLEYLAKTQSRKKTPLKE